MTVEDWLKWPTKSSDPFVNLFVLVAIVLIVALALTAGVIMAVPLAIGFCVFKSAHWYMSRPMTTARLRATAQRQLAAANFPAGGQFFGIFVKHLYDTWQPWFPAPAVYETMGEIAAALYAAEEFEFVPSVSSAPSRIEEGRQRDRLLLQMRRCEDVSTTTAVFSDTLTHAFSSVRNALPPMACTTLDELFGDAELPIALATVPLIDVLSDAGTVVHIIMLSFFSEPVRRLNLFFDLRAQLDRNLINASAGASAGKTIWPDQHKGSAREIVRAYLHDTPFETLFDVQLPFSIADSIRFEHVHVVAGTGHGKTQTLQHLIMGDLSRPPEVTPSLVIIDSQGDMLAKIARLDLFDPEGGPLADRLVIVDPTDIDHPPALGLFDLNLARVRGYDARYREQIMNGVIELYDYIFGGLLGAEMTQKQNVIFRYLARLMLAIPDATILTLKDVMQDATPFIPYFEAMEGSAGDFFRHDFDDRQFGETKKQILRRLWGVLENPTFERLFSHPRNKLDMFAALNTGKIVLVNTAKDFLKAERSSILGRFFIALTFQAALERAALPEHLRRPAFLYIDEAADYFDDTIDSLLTQARKFCLGVVFAHQYLDQLPRELRASIMTNASIKLAGGVSSADAHALAPNMRTTHEFVAGVRKHSNSTEFATHVRNLTSEAITLSVPFGTLESAPRMSDEAYARVIAANRQRYAAHRDEPRPATAHRDNLRPAAATADRPEDEDWRS
ncbi:MAG TPA: type IV secretory system conjugative DNA transfer family protein [Candidatus Eremiobacteraceae bacterium]|nr:type IV secretory system conjugative DNA transfer family protein [Candidatus Eremiobacteraceae bacterium]